MTKPPSLQDVARLAGLSPTTVSRYLNGSLVLPKVTSTRIDEAISALNYRPNPHARSLSRGRSDMIGLLIPDIDNPFFARLAAVVEREADAAGLALMLCSTLNRPQRELEYIESLRRNFVDGLLFATNHADNGDLAGEINRNTNIVLVDEDIDGVIAPKIFADNWQGGMLAASHIVSHGHSRLAFIGGPEPIMSTRERANGFRHGVSKASSRATVEAAFFGAYTINFGRDAITSLLETTPGITAIFVASDEILYGVLEVLRERHIRVGHDLSLVTFDDAGPLAHFDPPITAIRQPISEIGRQAFQLLRNRLEGMTDNPVIHVPVELIVRNSVRRMDD